MPHEVIIFVKFHEDRTKNVDFLLLANFLMCLVFYSPDFIYILGSHILIFIKNKSIAFLVNP